MSGNKNSGRPKNRTPCKTIRKGFRLTEKQHEIFDRARGDIPLSTYVVELALQKIREDTDYDCGRTQNETKRA